MTSSHCGTPANPESHSTAGASTAAGAGLSGGLFGGLSGVGGLQGGLLSGGLDQGDLASLSTLTGLLDTASTFQKPPEEDTQRPARRGNNKWGGRRYEGPGGGGPTNRGSYKAHHTPDIPSAASTGDYEERQRRTSRSAVVEACSVEAASHVSPLPVAAASSSAAATAGTAVSTSAVAEAPSSDKQHQQPAKLSDTGHPPPTPPPASTTAAAAAAPDTVPATAPAPWRPKRSLDPDVQLKRETQGLLNKLTIENFHSVGERLAARLGSCDTAKQVEIVVETVVGKAVSEPDFSQLYADLCLVLCWRCPACVQDPTTSGSRSVSGTFNTVLLNYWRKAFEALPREFNFTEEQAAWSAEDKANLVHKSKSRVRGACILLAELLIRGLVSLRAFNFVASELLSNNPPEHFIEGLCLMLQTAGAFLDKDPKGKGVVDNCFGRLNELKTELQISTRLDCLLRNLEDTRRVRWHKRIHKDKAKALQSIKEEMANADLVGGSVVTAQYGTVVQLGERSNLEEVAYAKYMNEQEQRFLQRPQP